MDNFLTGKIDKIEDNKVIVRMQNGEHLIWPIEKMPFAPTVGAEVKIILNAQGAQAQSENAAKDLLNEILQTP